MFVFCSQYEIEKTNFKGNKYHLVTTLKEVYHGTMRYEQKIYKFY